MGGLVVEEQPGGFGEEGFDYTVRCGPGGIFMSALGGAVGDEGPGGVALIDHDTFEVIGPPTCACLLKASA
ncbi:MAG TPA: hypothetical protein VLZ05_20735 [Mycobacterium sp.]|nr:hypothetical protein [Mycobacterium sp.]HUH71082.1 hypothetical protein [Mycobacterium sp.]